MKKSLICAGAICLALLGTFKGNAQIVYAADGDLKRIDATYTGDPLPEGIEIDKSDFNVYAYYEGSSKKHKLSSSEFDIDPDKVEDDKGRQSVTVSYKENSITKTDTVRITIREPYVEEIDAEYIGDDVVVGGTIDADDVRVKAYYENDDWDYIDDWYFSDYTIKKGNNSITICYDSKKTVKTKITVYGVTGDLVSISATYTGGNVTVGSQIDKSKIQVTGEFEVDRSYSTAVITGWTLDSYNIKEGTNTITVRYKSGSDTYTTTFKVTGVVNSSSTENNNPDSTIATNADRWEITNGKYQFYKANTTTPVKNQWLLWNNQWYFLDADGNMVTGWKKIGGNWYYLQLDGVMKTGWISLDGQWYFLNDSGAMQTGWMMNNGRWYLLLSDGAMAQGWQEKDGRWYFLTPGSGVMRTGWITVDGKQYYLNPSGDMAVNTWIGNSYVNGLGEKVLVK